MPIFKLVFPTFLPEPDLAFQFENEVRLRTKQILGWGIITLASHTSDSIHMLHAGGLE